MRSLLVVLVCIGVVLTLNISFASTGTGSLSFSLVPWDDGPRPGGTVLIGSNSILDADETTVEAWFKPESYPTGEGQDEGRTIIWNGDGTGGHDPYWILLNPDGALEARVDYESPYQHRVIRSASSLRLNTWHHFALAISIDETRLYVDGIQQPDTILNAGPACKSTNYLAIGRSMWHWNPYEGLIDEVRIWNVSRTDEEIRESMWAGRIAGDETGLISYWDFTQGTDPEVLYDLTANHMDGEIHGALWYGENAPSKPTSGVVMIPDANLEAAIRGALGKPTGALTEADLAGLTYLSARSRNISDLTGLEYCTNLTGFDLRSNQIGDISVLAYLPDLTAFLLSRNQVSDIGALENLTNLTSVEIAYNQISDISALANLISLMNLQLEHNQIGDIRTLTNLTGLSSLQLDDNRVTDISALSNLTNLTDLDLDRNNITDINALANLTNLTHLDLAYSKVSDISVLANLTNLTDLEIEYNQIGDIKPLVNNTGLGEGDSINLKGNPLNDDAYENHIPALETRGVSLILDPQSDGTPVIGIATTETVSEGESFCASVDVGNITDLAGFQLDVAFDPAILEAVGAEEGTFLSDGGGTYCLEPDIDNAAGRISSIACARTGEGGVDGSGMLVAITFKAIGKGESYIRLQNTKLSDSTGNLMPHTAVDGSVTVIGLPPWDVNKDGGVDILDLVLVGQHFGEEITTSLDPNPDVNGDGEVDILDFVLVGQHFGETYFSAAPSRGMWSFDAKYLPVLIRMYDILEGDPGSDPGFLATKRLLHRIIFSSRISETRVFQNYPNPFNPETWIPYQLADDSEVDIMIYNAAGQLIRHLDLGHKEAGLYVTRDSAAHWDGATDTGERASSGIYFYSIHAGGYSVTKKMIIVQ